MILKALCPLQALSLLPSCHTTQHTPSGFLVPVLVLVLVLELGNNNESLVCFTLGKHEADHVYSCSPLTAARFVSLIYFNDPAIT
jgi:hypothetical protein